MKILVACEESQRVTIELRKRGHEAYSCDIIPCSGGYPKWHLQQDVEPLLKDTWDMIIAFPPCTHLCNMGARWRYEKWDKGLIHQALDFFGLFIDVDCPKVAIENPVGMMSRVWRKPDQYIQPYEYGDRAQKKTCLWLKGLPKLVPTNIVGRGEFIVDYKGRRWQRWFYSGSARIRSKTFPGIAKAMAEQWA